MPSDVFLCQQLDVYSGDNWISLVAKCIITYVLRVASDIPRGVRYGPVFLLTFCSPSLSIGLDHELRTPQQVYKFGVPYSTLVQS